MPTLVAYPLTTSPHVIDGIVRPFIEPVVTPGFRMQANAERPDRPLLFVMGRNIDHERVKSVLTQLEKLEAGGQIDDPVRGGHVIRTYPNTHDLNVSMHTATAFLPRLQMGVHGRDLVYMLGSESDLDSFERILAMLAEE